MNGMQRRLKSLEKKSQGDAIVVGSIIRRIVNPGPEGPEDSGRAFATILIGPNKGMRLTREDGETMEAFERRVASARSDECT